MRLEMFMRFYSGLEVFSVVYCLGFKEDVHVRPHTFTFLQFVLRLFDQFMVCVVVCVFVCFVLFVFVFLRIGAP